MQNSTKLKNVFLKIFLFLNIILTQTNSFAEGTPTVSPNAANITALLSAPDLNSGPFFDATEDSRVKFTIRNNESLYFGFDWRGYSPGSPARLANLYWRIRRSSDLSVVVATTLWNPATGVAGSIDNHPQALAGPNIAGTVPTGYIPLVFNPALGVGVSEEYFIEFFRSNDGGVTPDNSIATGRAVGALFDLTVAATSSPYTKFNGRVNSDKWGFVAVSATYGNLATANAEPVLYGYTNDQTLVRLDFETGFQPIAFNVSLNSYGTTNVGSWLTTRISRNDAIAPSLSNGFKVFLNIPDVALYVIGAIPANPTFLNPAISGCGPYALNFNVAEPGDVKILLDLNGVAGFQSATSDRILEGLNVLAGNNTLAWDGLNGLGAPVASGTNLNLALTFLKGRFNLPLYDAELNRNGLRISITAPIPIANAQMYWDDSTLTNVGADCTLQSNNQTGAGINNSITGTTSPAHAWSGNGNIGQAIPAPAVGTNETDGNQCTDFGNVRTINTWGWGYTSASTNLNLVFGCADLSIVKTVNNASPNVGSNVTFTLTASNGGSAPSPNTIVNDLLSSGYTFVSATPSVGTYTSGTGVWSIGTLNSGSSATINIVATVLASGNYANTASVSGNQVDPDSTNNSSSITPTPLTDRDGDGINDIVDLDDDNDGILDTVEGGPACSNSAVTSLNTVPLPFNTLLNTSATQSPVNVNNLISGSLNVSATLVGSTTWQTASGTTPNNGGGVQIKNNSVASVGDYIYFQPVNTNTTSLTGANTTNFATFILNYSSPIVNFSFESAGLNNTDTFEIYAFNGATPVPLNTSNLSGFSPALTPSDWNVIDLGDGLKVVGLSSLGGTNVDTNLFTTSISSPITRIEIRSYKNSTGASNTTGNVTTAVTTFQYCNQVAFLDTDGDTIPNYQDLDSDNDGCSDSNEYYNSAAADGNDGGQYGVGPDPVPTNANGTVTAASYTGSYVNVVNNTIFTACVIDAVNDAAVTVISNNTTVTAINALTNDTLSGLAATTSNTNVTPLTTGPLSISNNGIVTVAPNTPSGTYTITYQLCESNPSTDVNVTPANCDTAVATVIVANPIDAINDGPTTLATAATPTIVQDVTANDTLNGVLVTALNTDVTPVTTGPLSVDSQGVLTLAPNTPSGTYTITYQLCEVGATPANCDTAVATVIVANPIDAINDGPTTLATAATPTIVQDVTANDTLNGVLVTSTNTDVTPVTTGPLSVDSQGVLTLAPNTPSGTYTITYQLCEVGATPANCDTAVATVIVANPILANNDTLPGNGGSVLGNDTLNGNPVTTTNTDVTPTTNGPLTIDVDGNVTVAPGTPSGTYTITYQLCEVGSTPANCDTAVATVVVATPIEAINDPAVTVVSGVSVTPAGNVLGNDTFNNLPATTTNTDITPSTQGPISVDIDGNLTLAPNTPSGTYTITYQLCETGATPANCDTAVATVIVANPIDAVNDAAVTVISNNTTVTAINALTNDTLSGLAATTSNTNVTLLTTGPLSISNNGIVTVAPNTPSGTYTITYQLCESNPSTDVNVTPANCDTAVATVIVANPIDAINDGPTTLATAATPTIVQDVTANDTLNGVLVTALNTDVTPVTTGPLSVDSQGVLTLAPNTPSGTYTITYQLCEVGATPANCDTAVATVIVANPIDAINDGPTTLATAATPTIVQDVTANDTLNGVLVTSTNTDVTPVTTGPLSVDSQGVLTLAPNTPSGTYTITYQLCEVGATPANCDTAVATVIVANPILANNDTLPGNGGSVLGNDTLNGNPVTTTNTDVTPTTNGPLTIDVDGNVTVAPGTPSGTYTITYQLCEVGSTPANCDTAVATVVVATPIEAINDPAVTVVSGVSVTPAGNVLGNDTFNNLPATTTNTDITPSTQGPISVDIDGNLTLAPNTPSGTYTITYQLCETGATPANCDTAVATVIVANPIDAVNDAAVTVISNNTTVTAINALTNDTLSGLAATTSNTNVTPLTTGPLSISNNGIVTVAPNTPSGTYTITYQLCESNPSTDVNVTPANCDTAVATVIVANPIDAINDGPTTLATAATPTIVQDVTANDTLNGVLVTALNTDVTPVTTGPLSVDSQGVLTLAPNTPSGTYTITYQLCEVGATPANCDTAVATVIVANPIDAINDGPTTLATAATPTIVQDVTANDTLNGVLVTALNTDVTPVTTGPLSVDSQGVLTLAPNTPSGTYTITYQLCEVGATPANCNTAVATVIVANPILANNDTLPGNGGSVLGNDTLNGNPVTTTNTDVTPTTNGPLTIDVDGNVTVAPGTPSGTYTITYQLCEVGSTPANCDTAVATVVVATPIEAINDPAVTVVSGVSVTPAGNVLGNDTFNNLPATTTNTDITPSTQGPISVDIDGNLTLAPNTPSGTYTITYQLCETGATPANCDTAVATVIVANPIDAVNDAAVTVISNNTTVTAINALTNDTLSGLAATTSNTNVTPLTTGPLSISNNGIVTVAPNTPSGTYTITYQLCESNPSTDVNVTPANCDTAVATVIVANPIDAINDGPTTLATAATPTIVQDVTANDTLNGVLVTALNTDVTPVTTGPLSVDSQGVLTLAPNTPSGTYTITYQLCEVGATPANCDTAVATVIVANPIDAINDGPTTLATAATPTIVQDVTANDTLNGVLVTSTNTDVTPVTTGPLSVDSQGVLTLAPNTPSGTYTITYQLCEVGATPANCDTAVATVIVANPILANNDTLPGNGGSVLGNDTLNGNPVTTTNTDVTPTTNGPLTIDVDGNVTVAPGTPSGTYTITYQLCEVGSTPANCDTAVATVVVATPIEAINDPAVTVVSGVSVTPAGNVLGNDTFNNLPATTTNTDITPSTQGPISVDIDGNLTLAPNTPSGTYTITYQLCETGATPANCDTAVATVIVANPIDAVNDAAVTVISNNTTVTAINALTNDTLSGLAATTSNTNVTPLTTGPLSISNNGIVTVAPNTPSGTYTITYQLCESNPSTDVNVTPANCDTAVATVIVANPIDAINDGPTTLATAATSTIVQDVTANDTLNGVLVTALNTDVTPVTTGPLSVDSQGVLTLAPNTPSGTYTITYQLCEVGATPANCDTAVATVIVANPIDAINDGPTTLATAATPTIVQDVTANDTLNGVLVTALNTDVTPVTTGPLSVDSQGVLTLAPNTPSGTYTITYQLCEVGATPANCDTAVATVIVANPILANNDTLPGNGGSVLGNDTLNGNPVTTTNTDVTPTTNGPLTIDVDGNVTVAPGTPSGTYTITYQLCEVGSTPANCDTAVATVVVATPIEAINDPAVTVVSGVSVTPAGNVLGNDTFNNLPATTTNTDITPSTQGPISVDIDGNLTLAPNTPSGTYTITYQLCETGATPANCDTAVATVIVANPIDAVNDAAVTVISNNTTVTAINALTNDTLSGLAATTSNTNVTPLTTGPLSISNNGIVTVAPNTPSGTYTITYQLCESNPSTDVNVTPANCDTAVATVIVANPIDAINDGPTTLATAATPTIVQDVTANDTLNGVLVTALNTDVTPVTTGPLSVDSQGVLTLAPNTPSGTYTITYQLCEVGATPANCDTAVATVIVANPIDAINDGPTTLATAATPTIVQDVTANDTLNGVLVTALNTDVTPVTTGPLSVDSQGVLTLAPNTPSGTYTITYQLCEVGATPANCDTAVATVIVANPILANNDTLPGNGGSVLGNDTLNGNPVTTTNTDVTPTTNGPLTIDVDGNVTVAPGTPSGTYTITYQLCEVGSTPANCDTAVATVVVATPIEAINDPAVTVVSGVSVTPAGNVLGNDTFNNLPATTTNTDITPSTQGPISVDIDGNLTLAPNTPSGTYTITYQLCETGATPANCDTAVATVIVANPIDAVNDAAVTVISNNTTVTAINALTNDTLSGLAATTSNTNVTPLTTGPLSISNNGIVTVAPNTPSGTYTITYQLCESNPSTDVNVTPANCDTAVATVIVANPIDAINDGPTTLATAATPTIVQDVTANDTLNGVLVTALNTDVTPVTTGPLSVDSQGVLTLAPNTPSGTYTITYQLCEVGATPANCDTAVATVIVANPIDAINDGPTTLATAATPTIVQDVTANDTLNGVLVTSTNTDVTPVTTGPLSVDSQGVLTLAPNTPSGTYTITYQLCEVGATPANCDTAVATVIVANPILANNDTLPGNGGSVLGNDTLNGNPVTTTNTDVTPTTNGPLTIDVDGNVTVAPGTPSGTYTITYQLCEVGSTPANCDTAVATVVVATPIEAINDPAVTVVSGVSVTPAGNVLGNDTFNNLPATTTNTDITPSTQGPISVDIDGNLTLAPNTPSGTYTITYQLCETGATPANCDTAVATVIVANPIDAVNDAAVTVISNNTTVTAINALTNDTLSGLAATTSNTNVTLLTTGPLSISNNGIVTVAPNTPSGTYTITYQLCESNPSTDVNVTPANCDTAVATVIVANPIDAINDGPTTLATAATPTIVQDVTANDTLNGVLVTALNTDVTPVTTGPLSVDSQGVLTLAPNTPSGTYTITYQLCEVGATPANCDTAVATVIVANPIDAINDGPTTLATAATPTIVQDVTANDTLNGVLVTSTNTDVTPVTTGPLSVDSQGVLTLAPNTPSGTYTITYQLCEVGATPANCDTAVATVIVANPIDAINDGPTTLATAATPTIVQDVTANDTLNGVLVTSTNTDVTPVTTGPLSIDMNGILILAPNTPTGTYTITYIICETNPTTGIAVIPANCDSASITVTVVSVIDSINDDYTNTPVNSENGGSFVIYENDLLNESALNPSDVTFTIIDNAGISDTIIDVNGNLIIPAGTEPGTYILTYSICEVINPSNCDSSLVTIVIKDPCEFDDSPVSCDLKIFNALTINDDGDNESFVIQGIEAYPNNNVCIFNRWGVLVYDTDSYDNTSRVFRGVSEGRSTIKRDSGLPEGTYFYVIKYNKNNGDVREKAGYLYLNRK